MSEEVAERAEDPRVTRSKKAAIEAAGRLFLRDGYAAATMDDVAREAGLTKRTLYNNFDDKATLYLAAISDMIGFAEAFAKGMDDEFFDGVAIDPESTLHDLGQRFATSVVRTQVVALRRLLISESAQSPTLATEYFERAPGAVLAALKRGFAQIKGRSALAIDDPRMAAEHYAYLVVGALLDRAILTTEIPGDGQIRETAKAGVDAFLAAYLR